MSKKYNISDWKDMRTTLMQDIGTDARKNHEEGLVQAQSFINQSGDEGEDFYASYAKKSRPTTLKDLIMNKFLKIYLLYEKYAHKNTDYLDAIICRGIFSFALKASYRTHLQAFDYMSTM